jgi:hypothetical protein
VEVGLTLSVGRERGGMLPFQHVQRFGRGSAEVGKMRSSLQRSVHADFRDHGHNLKEFVALGRVPSRIVFERIDLVVALVPHAATPIQE